jgi:hypothetical protein
MGVPFGPANASDGAAHHHRAAVDQGGGAAANASDRPAPENPSHPVGRDGAARRSDAGALLAPGRGVARRRHPARTAASARELVAHHRHDDPGRPDRTGVWARQAVGHYPADLLALPAGLVRRTGVAVAPVGARHGEVARRSGVEAAVAAQGTEPRILAGPWATPLDGVPVAVTPMAGL